MNARMEIEKRIEKKQAEIREHEKAIGELNVYLQALQDMLKFHPKDADCQALTQKSLRQGSKMEKVQTLLRKTGKPLYIEDILRGIGLEVTKGNRNAIAGSLSGYVRRREIFTKSEPGTFGLVEFSTQEPPEGFGEDVEVVPAPIEPQKPDTGGKHKGLTS